MKKLLLILLCLPFLIFSQTEKRLALVIGNSDYEFTTKLKNPVNDALLIAKTLEELEFDVILGTNLADEDAFFDKIEEFAEMRPDYDAAFVFYAGHGSQIENQNYLLPTGINAKTEWDVKYKAVSVQMLMDVLTGITDEVNVLILDACRDNNFEKNWNEKTRSASGKGSGLAKMKAPSGSLIAFSTTAGTTAPDGEGMNSDYSRVLAEQMKVPGISLDQVFRNVRREIFEISNGNQQTEEATQLTGETFYLVKSNFEKQFALIDSLILDENLDYRNNDKDRFTALEIVSSILNADSENRLALIKKGEIYTLLEDYDNALNIYDKVIESNPNDPVCYMYRGYLYSSYPEEFDNAFNNALNDFNQSLKIDSMYRPSYSNRADVYFLLEDYQSALPDYTKAINLQKDNPYRYKSRAECYKAMKDYTSALKDLDKAIDLAPTNPLYYNNRADFYREQENYNEALKDYAKAIEIATDDDETTRALNNRALIYENQGKDELAIAEYTKAIALSPKDPLYYSNRAAVYLKLENYEKALIDYNHLVDNNHQNVQYLLDRSNCLSEMKKFDLAINDLNKVLRIDSLTDEAYYNRSTINWMDLKKTDLGILDMSNAIKINPTDPLYFTFRASMFQDLDSLDLVLPDLTKAIELDSNDAYTWNVRGQFFESIGDVDNAIKDRLTAITVDSLYTYAYYDVIELYEAKEDLDNAEYFYTRLIALFPDDPAYLNDRADFYNNQGRSDEALKDYATVIEISTDDYSTSRAINNSANIYWEQEKWELCIEEYTKAIDIDGSATYYSNRGRVYQIIGKYEKAIADINKSIELDSEDLDFYDYRAEYYIEIGEVILALNDYSTAIGLSPLDPERYTVRADFYASNDVQEYDLALEDYNTSIELDKERSISYFNRGLFYAIMTKKNIDKGIDDFDQAIKLDSLQIDYYTYRAFAYQLIKNYDRAISDLEKAIELDPTNIGANFSKISLYARKGEYNKALLLCNELKDQKNLDGYEWSVNTAQINLFFLTGQHDKAFEELTKAIDNTDYNYENEQFYITSLIIKVKMLIFRQQYENAIDECKKIIAINPIYVDAYLNLGIISSLQKEYFRSAQYYTKLLSAYVFVRDDAPLPMRDDYLINGLYFFEENMFCTLGDIYNKRGESYQKLGAHNLMCEDYKKACDLGDCDMFNANCK